LDHELQPLKTDQVAVGLGRAHAGSRGQVAQHQGAGRGRQHLQQAEADSTDWMPARCGAGYAVRRWKRLGAFMRFD
jgi:hypothetical protein